jgi:hypothetical protein
MEDLYVAQDSKTSLNFLLLVQLARLDAQSQDASVPAKPIPSRTQVRLYAPTARIRAKLIALVPFEKTCAAYDDGLSRGLRRTLAALPLSPLDAHAQAHPQHLHQRGPHCPRRHRCLTAHRDGFSWPPPDYHTCPAPCLCRPSRSALDASVSQGSLARTTTRVRSRRSGCSASPCRCHHLRAHCGQILPNSAVTTRRSSRSPCQYH